MARTRRIAFAVAVLALSAAGIKTAGAADEIVVLSGGGAHRTIVLVVEGPKGAEIALEEAAKGLDVSFSRAGKDARVTLKSGGREVVLDNGKSLFSAAGQLRALSSPVRVVGDRTYVSPSSAALVLGAALAQPSSFRPAYRALVIGAYEAPRLRVSNVVAASAVDTTVELSKPVPYDVRREPNRVTVTFQADVMETEFSMEALPGRIVSSVRFERSTPPKLVFDLGDRFTNLRTPEHDSQRLTLGFDASMAPGAAPPPGATPSLGSAVPPARPAPAGGPFKRPVVLVIDPGHGGEDAGARGPGGRLEKDVTLALARRIRAAAVDTLSIQAFLTRDADAEVPLDERAAIANNFNADIFISLHANGSRAPSASGTEVFFLSYTAADDDARRIALQEGAAAERPKANDKDVGLILWDMAQAAQLEASSKLAGRLQTEIAQASLTRSRGVKQAPFRVLVGATMPAALVEIGFITNPAEEKRLVSEEHQQRLTDAIIQGLARFISDLRPGK